MDQELGLEKFSGNWAYKKKLTLFDVLYFLITLSLVLVLKVNPLVAIPLGFIVSGLFQDICWDFIKEKEIRNEKDDRQH